MSCEGRREGRGRGKGEEGREDVPVLRNDGDGKKGLDWIDDDDDGGSGVRGRTSEQHSLMMGWSSVGWNALDSGR